MAVSDTRPFYLNLIKIRLPVAGMLSIFHRISGVLMFVATPYLIYLLDLSLQGETGFNRVSELLSHPISILIQIILLWALVHHFLAGIRFLLIDFDIGIGKQSSTYSAWLVFGLELVITLAIAAGVWL
ncbi:MAG: succinate dehydrogenase, cytochrome b556 subunit [Gammaproteobacteria bacterium]|nr:succinate dehydrogenase, cytochrome b556 subunit [Gammaproteobacteria bacterium]